MQYNKITRDLVAIGIATRLPAYFINYLININY